MASISIIWFLNICVFFLGVGAVGELKGVKLRGCALLEFPYVKHSDFGHTATQGFYGIAIDYLIELRDETGFDIHLSKWNRTFGEFVDHMGSCITRNISHINHVPGPDDNFCECDIGVGAFTMTNERLEKIDFLWPFANENHRMIGRLADLQTVDNGNLGYMFNTFSWDVWLLVAFAVLVYAVGTTFFGNHIKPVSEERLPTEQKPNIKMGNLMPVVDATRFIESIRPRKRFRADDVEDPKHSDDTLGRLSITSSDPDHYGYDECDENNASSMGDSADDKKAAGNDGNSDSGSNSKGGKWVYAFKWVKFRAQRLTVAIMYTFAMFIGQPVEADAAEEQFSSIHRISWRLLSLTAGMFLFCLYNSSLTVLLFESTKESRFQTIQDVKDCLVRPDTVSFIKGGASQALWTNAITDRGFCDAQETRHLARNIDHALELLRERKIDFFYSLEGAVLSVVHRRCEEFAVVGDPFFSTSIGFIVPKSSTLRGPLSRATRILREQDAFQSARTIAMRHPCEAKSAATITLDRLSFFFCAYFSVAAALILYRIVSVRISKIKKNPGR